MQRISLMIVLAAGWLGASATALPAQAWPGCRHCCPCCYGGCGVTLVYDLSAAGIARRCMGQSQHMLGQQIAAAQAAALQNDIRSAMATDAQRRCDQIYSQQRADRDWWLEVQQQQIAERQQAAQWAAMTAGFRPAPPQVATDLIRWPMALQAPPFAEQARIEAPYRRSPKGSSLPTATDYQSIVKAVEQMRSTLKEMTAKLTAEEYFTAREFLDRLSAQARQRLENATPKK